MMIHIEHKLPLVYNIRKTDKCRVCNRLYMNSLFPKLIERIQKAFRTCSQSFLNAFNKLKVSLRL